MSKDFVWNEADAEQVRYECEQAMHQQIESMQATGRVYQGWLPILDEHAREQEHIAATAMKSVRTRDGWVLRPDWQRREEARNRANSLREQIGLTGNAISNINRAIQGLYDAIDESNRHFWRMRNEAQATDRDFSRHVQVVDGDIATFIAKMQETNNGINEDGFSSHQRLAAINRMESLGKALTAIGALGDFVDAFPILNTYVGRALTSRGWQSRAMYNQFGGLNQTAHLEPSAIPSNVSNNLLGRFGRALSSFGHAATPVSMIASGLGHYEQHENPGRATLYSLYVAGGSSLIGTGIGVATAPAAKAGTAAVLTKIGVGAGAVAVGTTAAPLIVVAGVGAGAYLVLSYLYETNVYVRFLIDYSGDALNAFDWIPQNHTLESEFWIPETQTYNNGTAGKAVQSNSYINTWSPNLDSHNLK